MQPKQIKTSFSFLESIKISQIKAATAPTQMIATLVALLLTKLEKFINNIELNNIANFSTEKIDQNKITKPISLEADLWSGI